MAEVLCNFYDAQKLNVRNFGRQSFYRYNSSFAIRPDFPVETRIKTKLESLTFRDKFDSLLEKYQKTANG
jgi:hypothetical protein